MQRFRGKVVFVAGASSGIGRTTVKRFAAEGATVIFCARRRELLSSLEQEVRSAGGNCQSQVLDLNDLSAYVGALEAAAEQHGRLDVLVHSAGLTTPSSIDATSFELWNSHFRLNATASFAANAAAARIMKRGGGGAIVNIASIAAVRSVANYGAYGAAKAAMIQFSRSLAVERALDRVRVNVVAPGMIGTEALLRAFNNKNGEEIAGRIPMGRFGTPDELASAILFLSSDEASYITGQCLLVDGGKSAQMIV
jgi:meso-butanediol dehydrogenase/(S,S)-butanediol dehydrogenase/diacetyl reductase